MRRKTKLILLNTGFARIEVYARSSVMNTYSVSVLINSQTKIETIEECPQK
jgi:hypothetical protein